MASVRKLENRGKWYMTGCKGTPQEFCLATPFDHSPSDKEEKKQNKEKALDLAKVTEAIRMGKPADKIEPKLRGLMNEVLSSASKIALTIWLVAWVRWHCLSRNVGFGRTFMACQVVDRLLTYASSDDGLANPKLQLGQTTSEHLLKFLQHAHDTFHLCPDTVNNYHRTLKTAFGCAVTGRILTSNPAAAILKMVVPKGSVRTPFAIEEVLLVLKVCRTRGARGKEWEFVIRIAVGTAIRQDDICNLRPSNFRWDEDTPRIVYRPGKNRKYGREEVVRLNKELAEYAKAYLEELAPNAVYCTPMLAHRRTGSRSRTFSKFLELAGIKTEWIVKGARRIKTKTFHSFRHLVISILRANGCTLSEVMDFAGHTTIPASLNYTHKIPGWDIKKAQSQAETASKTAGLEKAIQKNLNANAAVA